MSESREFRTMLETKERELIAIFDQQIQSLNTQIREKESAVTELKDRVSQLQDDFKYNLSLLDARDAELAQYDASSAALEASVTEREERLKVARKALADAQTLRVQEKARADELEQICQQKISDMEKESLPMQIESLQRSKEELQAKAKQELESTKTELKGLLEDKEEKLEEEHKKALDAATKKWKEKIAKTEARLAESADDLESSEKRVEDADEKCKNLKKQLEAALASQKEDTDAASRRESLQNLMEEEQKSLINTRANELEELDKRLSQLKVNKDVKVQAAEENKDANVQAGDPASNLKEQLQELKAHHSIAVGLFKGEIDSLTQKLDSATSQSRTLGSEIGQLRKELEEEVRAHKELEEKHNELHNCFQDLQKELVGNKPHEGMLPQGPGPAEGAKGASDGLNSYPAASPPMFSGLSREDEIRINQGKLEAENSQLKAQCEDLSSQNDCIRDVVGAMRSEMEALQRQTESPSGTPESSPNEKLAGVKHLKEEVKHLKSLVQAMSDELGDLRAGSPKVHCRRPSQRRSGLSSICRPKSPTKFVQFPCWSRSSSSPPHAVVATSHRKRGCEAEGKGDQVPQIEIVNSSLRAQLEATKTDMTRIIRERDVLMELCNSLRADLSKFVHVPTYTSNMLFMIS